ncbi:MAG: UDP-glucose 4-epimerase GalE [Planctomycetota bacterium]|jgi:UDP-glucose 4-epimerase
MRILVTGGAGYIGSHTCVALMEAGHRVVVVDSLVNSSRLSLDRVRELTGRDLVFYEADLLNETAVERIFSRHEFDAVIHFAALKAVGESVEQPLRYYGNNITGSLILLEAMRRHKVRDLVFSSSAVVYGEPASVPITESFPLGATNPYGRSKLAVEHALRDLALAEEGWRLILLRYFNPVGAHESGRIGEDPRGIPNNLMPYVMQVAAGRLPKLAVFGGDYETRDGTGVRDYIHVVDLAEGHLAALAALPEITGAEAINLGTGRGFSVLEVIEAAEKASGREIPYEIVERRSGDIAECYADPSRAAQELSWRATRGIEEMTADHWRWQSRNPEGFAGEEAPEKASAPGRTG